MKNVLLLVLALFAVAVFVGGVITAVTNAEKPGNVPDFLKGATTTISTLLAANLGAVLGLAAKNVAGYSMIVPANYSPRAAEPSATQLIAAAIYLVVIAGVFAFWWLGLSFQTEGVVSTIPELAQSFLGVAVGALGVVLAVS